MIFFIMATCLSILKNATLFYLMYKNIQIYLNMMNKDFETFKFVKSDIRIKPLSTLHS